MSADDQLLLVIAGMHLLGIVFALVLILPALRDPPPPAHGTDSGSGGGGGHRPLRPKTPDSPRGGLPLPDASPARVRLRDHRRLPELLPKPDRRPSREPERLPVRVP